MPFSGSTFTLPNGATTAAAGQIIQSAVWNAIHSDLNTGLTMVMSQLVSTPSYRNAIFHNGSLDIWQRGAGGSGASIAVSASTVVYTCDRWYLAAGANQASVVAAADALSNASLLSGKVQRNAGQTGVTGMVFAYPLDDIDIVRLRGVKVTFSALVRAGANWSPASGTLTAVMYVGTGSPTKRNATPYTNEVTMFTLATNLSIAVTTAISVTSSIVVPTNTTQAEIQFTWTPVGTAGADDSVSIDDVQIEGNFSDSTFTPTDYDIVPWEECLIHCKRHYQKTFTYSVAPATGAGNLGALMVMTAAAAKFGANWIVPVELRVAPDITTYNPSGANANWQDITGAATVAVFVTGIGAKSIFISGATAAAVDRLCVIHAAASAGI